jgi:hypothetical protein
MKLKKFLTSIIIAALIFTSAAAVAANTAGGVVTVSGYYFSFSGKVTHVAYPMDANLLTTDAPTYVYIEIDGILEITFLVYRESTYWITENKNNQIEIGADFTAIYDDANAPTALMIYPPQFKAEAIAVNLPAGQSVKMDRFDEELVSSVNNVKINITKDTEIIFEDGEKFNGGDADLINRKLLVYYSKATRVPGRTIAAAEKIVIFYEKAVPPVLTLSDEDRIMLNQALENAIIQVNGKAIANKAFISGSGYVMVPVREIAEAADYKVIWFGDTKTVQIGISLSFAIGKDAYAYNRMAPVSLGQAPVLRNSLTYVPVDFFISPDLGAASAGYVSYFDEDSETSVINIIFE